MARHRGRGNAFHWGGASLWTNRKIPNWRHADPTSSATLSAPPLPLPPSLSQAPSQLSFSFTLSLFLPHYRVSCDKDTKHYKIHPHSLSQSHTHTHTHTHLLQTAGHTAGGVIQQLTYCNRIDRTSGSSSKCLEVGLSSGFRGN